MLMSESHGVQLTSFEAELLLRLYAATCCRQESYVDYLEYNLNIQKLR